MLPERERGSLSVDELALGKIGGGAFLVGERPRSLSCLVELGVGIRVATALPRTGGADVRNLLAEFERGLGLGTCDTGLLLGGLGVPGPQTSDSELSRFTVELFGGESETSDGTVTAVSIRFRGIAEKPDSVVLFGDCLADIDLLCRGAKMAHLGGEVLECFLERIKECSWEFDDDEEEDTV